MKIAVLFDGAGLARLGLESAGHQCVGVELDPWKHHLSLSVGSGNCILADARDVDLGSFDAVWASPPCQGHSEARTQGAVKSQYGDATLLQWSLDLPHNILWVENVVAKATKIHPQYNAAQFIEPPLQNRNRIVGGRYSPPEVLRPFKRITKGVCPCITATEYDDCASDTRRASRFYGRKLTLEECAYHQGFDIPDAWRTPPSAWTGTMIQWRNQLYEAVGNGVPPFMSRAFGAVYT